MRRYALLLLCFWQPLWAEQKLSAEQWLVRMSQAADTLNYQGTLVYARGRELVSFRQTHVRDGEHEWEHLVQLDGRANEVLRGGGDLIYLAPGQSSTRMSVQPSIALRPETTADMLVRSRAYYLFVLTPGERIAGREAVQVTVKPLQADRYGHVFYLERSSGLLLRSVLLDAEGRVLETLGFSSLAVGADVGRVDYRRALKAAAKVAPVATAAAASPVPPRWQWQLPAGFVAGREGLHARQINGARVEVVAYSDGFSSFTVFAEPLGAGQVRTGESRRGATSMVSRVLQDDKGSWLLTVVGELPMSTLQQFVDSVRAPGPNLPR